MLKRDAFARTLRLSVAGVFLALIFTGCALVTPVAMLAMAPLGAVTAPRDKGCSATTPEGMKEEIGDFNLTRRPEPNQAMVYVVRPTLRGMGMSFRVFLDDKADQSEIGATLHNEYIFFSVSPGDHTIYSWFLDHDTGRRYWVETLLSAKSGEAHFIQQNLETRPPSVARIDELTAKCHIKYLTVGQYCRGPVSKRHRRSIACSETW